MHSAKFSLLTLLALISFGLLPMNARADDAQVCADESGDVAIAACTRAIKSGRYGGHALAAVYNNRCTEYLDKEEFVTADDKK